MARKKEEVDLLVMALDDAEARAAAAAAAVLLVATQANAAARGKPNSIHAETHNSTSTRWKESGRQTTLPAGMPWSHEGLEEARLGREEVETREEEWCWGGGRKKRAGRRQLLRRLPLDALTERGSRPVFI